MNVVGAFWALMILIVAGLWLEENWKVGSTALAYVVHFIGMCNIAMMRHTGNPRYTHRARRYRA